SKNGGGGTLIAATADGKGGDQLNAKACLDRGAFQIGGLGGKGFRISGDGHHLRIEDVPVHHNLVLVEAGKGLGRGARRGGGLGEGELALHDHAVGDQGGRHLGQEIGAKHDAQEVAHPHVLFKQDPQTLLAS